MKIYHVLTRTNYLKHRSLVMIDYVPNWFERFVLRWSDIRIKYVGLGLKWQIQKRDGSFTEIPPLHTQMILPILQQAQSSVNFKERYLLKKGVTVKLTR